MAAIQSQFGQSKEFHAAQVHRLQSEISGFKAEGKHKEAEARMAYLTYHQNEITKIKGIVDLAGEKGSLMEQAVSALQVIYPHIYASYERESVVRETAYMACLLHNEGEQGSTTQITLIMSCGDSQGCSVTHRHL